MSTKGTSRLYSFAALTLTFKILGLLLVIAVMLIIVACGESTPEPEVASIDSHQAEVACAKYFLFDKWMYGDLWVPLILEAVDAARKGDRQLYFALVNFLDDTGRLPEDEDDWVIDFLELPDDDVWVVDYRSMFSTELDERLRNIEYSWLDVERRCGDIGFEIGYDEDDYDSGSRGY
jgi:hypothetical protein